MLGGVVRGQAPPIRGIALDSGVVASCTDDEPGRCVPNRDADSVYAERRARRLSVGDLGRVGPMELPCIHDPELDFFTWRMRQYDDFACMPGGPFAMREGKRLELWPWMTCEAGRPWCEGQPRAMRCRLEIAGLALCPVGSCPDCDDERETMRAERCVA